MKIEVTQLWSLEYTPWGVSDEPWNTTPPVWYLLKVIKSVTVSSSAISGIDPLNITVAIRTPRLVGKLISIWTETNRPSTPTYTSITKPSTPTYTDCTKPNQSVWEDVTKPSEYGNDN